MARRLFGVLLEISRFGGVGFVFDDFLLIFD